MMILDMDLCSDLVLDVLKKDLNYICRNFAILRSREFINSIIIDFVVTEFDCCSETFDRIMLFYGTCMRCLVEIQGA